MIRRLPPGATHWCQVRRSGSWWPCRRWGKVLIIFAVSLRGRQSVSTPLYDDRFLLYPKGYTPE